MEQMKQTDNTDFAVGMTLFKDDDKITRIEADLTEFCKMLNSVLASLIKGGYIGMDDIDREKVNALAVFDAEPITAIVRAKYEKEAKSIKYERRKIEFLKEAEKVSDDIKGIVKTFSDEYKKHPLRFYKPYDWGAGWRLHYLVLTESVVTFDRQKVEEEYTQNVLNEAHAAYLDEARELFMKIKEFNAKTLRMSQGTVYGVGYANNNDAIINVTDNGKIVFDAALSADFDFEDEEGKQ